MEVVVNVLAKNKEETIIHYLETMPKKQILKLLVSVAAQPSHFILALADDLSPVEEIIPAKEYITLAEWLDSKGVTLDTSEKHRLASLLSKMYEEKKGSKPRVITRPDSRGKWLKKANGFLDDELDILQDALNTVVPDWKKRSKLQKAPKAKKSDLALVE